MFPTMIKVALVLVVGLSLLYFAASWFLVHKVGYGPAPGEAQRLAVRAVEQQRNVEGVTVSVASRAGNCAIVAVMLPGAQFQGPSVSLEKSDGKWRVRRIGDDFDTD